MKTQPLTKHNIQKQHLQIAVRLSNKLYIKSFSYCSSQNDFFASFQYYIPDCLQKQMFSFSFPRLNFLTYFVTLCHLNNAKGVTLRSFSFACQQGIFRDVTSLEVFCNHYFAFNLCPILPLERFRIGSEHVLVEFNF